MRDLKLSQIKQICEIIGCNPTDLPNELDDWKLLDDSEADEQAAEYIEQSLWAFNTSFLMAHVKKNITEGCIDALKEQYEDANEPIKELIEDFEHFVDDAMRCDGRGHFLSSYDGEEHEITGNLYLYREN